MTEQVKDGEKKEDGNEDELTSVTSPQEVAEMKEEPTEVPQEESQDKKEENVASEEVVADYGTPPPYSSMIAVDLPQDYEEPKEEVPQEESKEKEEELSQETVEDETVSEVEKSTEVDGPEIEEKEEKSDIKSTVRQELDSMKKVFNDKYEKEDKPKDTPLAIKSDSFESNVEESPPTSEEPKNEEGTTPNTESKGTLSMGDLPPEIQNYFKDVHPAGTGGKDSDSGKDGKGSGKDGDDPLGKKSTKWTTTILDGVKNASKATVRMSRHIEIISWCFVVICAVHVGLFAMKAYYQVNTEAMVSELWNTIIMAVMTLAWANNSGRLPTKKNKDIKRRIKKIKDQLTNTGGDESYDE